MTVVDVRKKKSKVVPYKELERYSILIGTGPFRLTQFTAELVRLESHDYYVTFTFSP